MIVRLGCCLVVCLAMLQADTLRLRDGSALTGTWLGTDGKKVRFVVDDQVKTFSKSEVQQVLFGDAAAEPPDAAQEQNVAPVPRRAALPVGAMTQVQNGVRIQIQKCERRASEAVVCSFMLESLKSDVNISLPVGNNLNNSIFIVDGNGIQQLNQTAKIGAGQSTLAVQQVPVKGEIGFGGVDLGVLRIAVLNLWVGMDRDSAKFVFRNIPLQ